MKIYSQLEEASLENLGSDPSVLPRGRFWHNTSGDNVKVRLASSTDVVVLEAKAATLTNKSIDGDSNTLSNIGISSLKTALADANKFIVRDGSGAVISSKAVPSGTVVGTTDSQVLTNKDVDGGTASNSSRITVPAESKATLDGLTRKAGTLVYATDEARFYGDNGTSLQSVGGGQHVVSTSPSLASGGTISITLIDGFLAITVGTAAGPQTLSATPFGASAPLNGALIALIGLSDTDYPIISANDAAKGCVGNFSELAITKNKVVRFMYISSLDRYVYVE